MEIKQSSIDRCIADRAKELADWFDFWSKHSGTLAPVVAKLEEMGLEPYLSGTWICLSFTGDKHKLADVVRVLRTAGFKTDSSRPQKDATSWTAVYRDENWDVTFYLTFSSSFCKRVQVGTETKEVPIFEVRCGEATDEVEV